MNPIKIPPTLHSQGLIQGSGDPVGIVQAPVGTLYLDTQAKQGWIKHPSGWKIFNSGDRVMTPQSLFTADLRHARHQIARAQRKLQAMGKGYGSHKKRKMWNRRLKLAKANFIAVKLRGAQPLQQKGLEPSFIVYDEATPDELLKQNNAGVQTLANGQTATGASVNQASCTGQLSAGQKGFPLSGIF